MNKELLTEHVDLSGANFGNDDIIGADLSRSSLCNADLSGVNTFYDELLTKSAIAYFGIKIGDE